MSLPSIDIDRVVREVLAELGAARVVDPKKNVEQKEKDEKQEPDASATGAADGKLVLTARVIAAGDLLGRLDSVRRVAVPRRAVVTPAARDELLRRGIVLEYAESAAEDKATVGLTLIVVGTDFDPAPLAAALDREGFRVDRRRSDCLIAAVDELAREITDEGILGVLLTPHAAAGLCLANRLPGVRAIGGCDAAAVAAAAAAVGANLLAADPAAGSYFQLKQVVAEFAAGGVRPCPEIFREKLR